MQDEADTTRRDPEEPGLEELVAGLRVVAPGAPAGFAEGTDEAAPGDAVADSRLRPPARRRRSLLIRLLLATVVVALSALGGTFGHLAIENRDRADAWAARSNALEADLTRVTAVLSERTALLNERTGLLNQHAKKLKSARAALNRSEKDVAQLATRQRALANEKAQVEDARAALAVERRALTAVAVAFVECKDGLVDLLSDVVSENWYVADYSISRVSDDCGHAETLLSEYETAYR